MLLTYCEIRVYIIQFDLGWIRSDNLEIFVFTLLETLKAISIGFCMTDIAIFKNTNIHNMKQVITIAYINIALFNAKDIVRDHFLRRKK